MIFIHKWVTVLITSFKEEFAKQRQSHANYAKYTKADNQESADNPAELTKNGWKSALKETKIALKDKELSTAAAGLAYYATLTFFPTLLGVATCFSYFAEPGKLLDIIDKLKTVIPPDMASLVQAQLAPLTRSGKTALGFGAVLSIVLLVWTLSGGIQNLIKVMNRAYDVVENRGLIKLRLASMLLSLGLLLFGTIICGLILLQGNVLDQLGAPDWFASAFPIVRWLILIVLISAALAFVYRYAPARAQPKWQWVGWGSTAATILWLAGSALFFLYVHNFADFNKTYGTFAGIIVMMTWFNLTSLIIVIGAQVNHNLEKQTTPKKVVAD